MAILSTSPGLKVEILVNNEPLPEYDENHDLPADHATVTKYVEAKPGAEFSINITFTKPFPAKRDVGHTTYVDGTLIENSFVSKSDLYAKNGFEVRAMESKLGSIWVEQPLRFSELSISNSHHGRLSNSLLASLTKIGTVRVIFDLGHATSILSEANSYSFSSQKSVPEEAMKEDARSIQFGLGEAKKIKPAKASHWTSHREAFATFNFKYRSLAELKALDIIPRTPTPDPDPVEKLTLANCSRRSAPLSQDDFDGLTKEDLIMVIEEYRGHDKGLRALNRMELLAMLKSHRRKKTTTIKRERDADIDFKDEDDDDVTVVESSSRKRRRGEEKEVIVVD